MIAQKTIGRQEVDEFVAFGRCADALTELIVFDVNGTIVFVDGCPTFFVLVEIRRGRDNRIAASTLTLRRVAVTETRRASEFIFQIQAEETRFAFLASTSFDIILAQARSGFGVTRRRIVQRAS